jgi:cytochrome c551/c552
MTTVVITCKGAARPERGKAVGKQNDCIHSQESNKDYEGGEMDEER